MKNLRAIIIILTATFALSACDSPTDITSKQNVQLVGSAPVKSVSVEVEKAVTQNVEELRASTIKSEFTPHNSNVDFNSNPARFSLNFSAESPVPVQQQGVFLSKFNISLQDIVADGREYRITSGLNQSSDVGAQFNTIIQSVTPQGQWEKIDKTLPASEGNISVKFTHQPGEKSIIGNLTAYMAKDTVIRIPLNISNAEADMMFQHYESMGFVPKFPPVSESDELVFPATQVLLNLKGKITIQY